MINFKCPSINWNNWNNFKYLQLLTKSIFPQIVFHVPELHVTVSATFYYTKIVVSSNWENTLYTALT